MGKVSSVSLKLFLFIALIISIVGVNCNVFADNMANGTCGPNIAWELKFDGTLNIEGQGQMYCWESSQDVPWNAFRSQIKSIVISNGILSIGNYAFLNCSNLNSIKMSDSVLDLGTHAFYGCNLLTDITFLSKGIKSLDSDAEFGFCNGLTNIKIPNHITYLNPSVFRDCKNIEKIHIPTSVTNTLNNFHNLGNQTLASIYVEKGNIQNWTVDDVLFTYIPYGGLLGTHANTLMRCSPQKRGDYIVPDGTEAIGFMSFYNCKYIKSVTIPLGVKLIDTDAFKECDNLTDIYFKGSEQAWSNVTIKDKTLNNISIHISGEVETDINRDNYGTCGDAVIWNFSDGTLSISGSGEMYDYDGLESTTPWKHLNAYINNIVINNQITNIGDYAFFSCENLQTITLPESIVDIGQCAFSYCASLSNIVWMGNIKHIGHRAFDRTKYSEDPDNWSNNILYLNNWIIDCQLDDETEFNIPKDVVGIADEVFLFLPQNLLQFTVDTTNLFFCSVDGILFSKDMTTLVRYPRAKENVFYEIPNTVTDLCNGAFYSCSNLKTIVIPEGVTHIKEYTFTGTYNLSDIYIPKSVQIIEGLSFMQEGRVRVVNDVYCPGLPLNVHYAGNKEHLNRIMIGSRNSKRFAPQEFWDALNATVINKFTETRVELNSQPLFFDQSPIIENGRTLVPLRTIFEMLGATVEWKDDTQTVISIKDDTKIEMTIGKKKFYKNGIAVNLDVPATVINGRTLVPVRAIAESFNCKVFWDEAKQRVLINE